MGSPVVGVNPSYGAARHGVPAIVIPSRREGESGVSSRTRTFAVLVLAFCAVVANTGPAFAQSPRTLSAEESDPGELGWMTGFPPPPERLIMQPESDYFSFPKLRWTVCHIRELMPTKQVNRGVGPPVPLDYAIDDGIDAVPEPYTIVTDTQMQTLFHSSTPLRQDCRHPEALCL